MSSLWVVNIDQLIGLTTTDRRLGGCDVVRVNQSSPRGGEEGVKRADLILGESYWDPLNLSHLQEL